MARRANAWRRGDKDGVRRDGGGGVRGAQGRARGFHNTIVACVPRGTVRLRRGPRTPTRSPSALTTSGPIWAGLQLPRGHARL